MSNYSHVQFIPWELYTGPFEQTNDNGQAEQGYSGIFTGKTRDLVWDQCSQYLDILARVEFTRDAILKAYQIVQSNPAPEGHRVLKVFMAPEFLYRGPAGAYIHDLIWGSENGQPGLFPMLQELVAYPEFGDWIFVFGTALSVAQGENNNWEIFNTALVQAGGLPQEPTQNTRVPRKKLKSDIDFNPNNLVRLLINSTNQIQGNFKIHSDGYTGEFDPEGAVRYETQDGGALFQFNHISDMEGDPIKFGLEICLDHAVSGPVSRDISGKIFHKNPFGRIRGVTAFEDSFHGVQIQLVPSGGMFLKNGSVFLNDFNAYAFNCDGLLSHSQGYGSHSQVYQNIGHDNHNNQQIFYSANGEEKADSIVEKVTEDISFGQNLRVSGENLWHGGHRPVSPGSGHVRVMAPLPLV